MRWFAVRDAERGHSSSEIIERAYAAGITDEFIKPAVITDADDRAVGPLATGDSVIFFNFRADRMRQITRAVAFEAFDGFDRVEHPEVRLVDDDRIRPDVRPPGRVHDGSVQRQPRRGAAGAAASRTSGSRKRKSTRT